MDARPKGQRNVFNRAISAGVRALLVAGLLALPSFMLPNVSSDTSQLVALLALVGGVLTFLEYFSTMPSFVEFRSAAPFNRIRFLTMFCMVYALTQITREFQMPTSMSGSFYYVGSSIGEAMDFPFSPVRLALLAVPEGAPLPLFEVVKATAGMAYVISLASIAFFIIFIRIMRWPLRNGAFNVWINLPLFDPTTGGDVLYRLKRDSNLNFALGFLLPFLIPAIFEATAQVLEPMPLSDPQTLVWMMTAWAFLPASLIMRGVALMRVAELIEEKRRRAYAQSDVLQAA